MERTNKLEKKIIIYITEESKTVYRERLSYTGFGL